MNLTTSCPVCNSTSVSIFLTREHVPIGQNILLNEQKTALQVPRGDLKYAFCGKCGFVFNAAFDPSLVIYGQEYDNAQCFSRAFDDYLSDLLDYLINDRGVRNCRIVEVGCGNGYFLQRLVERGDNTGIGYDPSYVGSLEALDGRLRFERSYYGSEHADQPADVVICRHVIEHIPDPLGLLSSIRRALSKSPSTYVFFETPTVEWILQNRAFWDFFYEHCSIFTTQSLATAFQQTGFKVEQIKAAFGGQYLWMEASTLPLNRSETITYDAGHIPTLVREFAVLENSLRRDWKQRVMTLHQHGGVAIWGAGAKGVTFANLVDQQGQYITCIVDLNPRKQGKFLSGTGHPIIDYQSLQAYNVKTVILMNPNYYTEISSLIQSSHNDIRVLDVNDEMERSR